MLRTVTNNGWQSLCHMIFLTHQLKNASIKIKMLPKETITLKLWVYRHYIDHDWQTIVSCVQRHLWQTILKLHADYFLSCMQTDLLITKLWHTRFSSNKLLILKIIKFHLSICAFCYYSCKCLLWSTHVFISVKNN